jgi:hypothetical protein
MVYYPYDYFSSGSSLSFWLSGRDVFRTEELIIMQHPFANETPALTLTPEGEQVRTIAAQLTEALNTGQQKAVVTVEYVLPTPRRRTAFASNVARAMALQHRPQKIDTTHEVEDGKLVITCIAA